MSQAADSADSAGSAPDVLLFDGVCGFCNGLVQFILRRRHARRFRFAPLQGGRARSLLVRHGLDPDSLDSIRVLVDCGTPNERILSESRAVLRVLVRLGFPWAFAGILRAVPRLVADPVYRFIARHRYRIFGRRDSCMIPSPEVADLFLGEEGDPS